jgi:hypothetical protein
LISINIRQLVRLMPDIVDIRHIPEKRLNRGMFHTARTSVTGRSTALSSLGIFSGVDAGLMKASATLQAACGRVFAS